MLGGLLSTCRSQPSAPLPGGAPSFTVTRADFDDALCQVRASVSPRELESIFRRTNNRNTLLAVEAGGGGCGKGSTSGPDPSTSYPGYGTAEQLYDLSVDATEQTNVAADATYVDDVKALRLEMDCHLKDTDITLAAPT